MTLSDRFLDGMFEWSRRTFGTMDSPLAAAKHLRSEADEVIDAIENERGDAVLEELADVVILAIQAAKDAGYTPDELAAAIVLKAERNKRRKWELGPGGFHHHTDEAPEDGRGGAVAQYSSDPVCCAYCLNEIVEAFDYHKADGQTVCRDCFRRWGPKAEDIGAVDHAP